MLRMLHAGIALWIALALLTPAQACPGRRSTSIAPCLAQDMLAQDRDRGRVRHVIVNEADVTWYRDGEPEPKVEHIRIAGREIEGLVALAAVRPDELRVTVNRRPRAPEPVWLALLPALVSVLLGLLILWRVRRRQGLTVQVLTRNVERREAFALAYATLMVVGLIWATWPQERRVPAGQLNLRLDMGLIHDVTYGPYAVRFKQTGSAATYVVPGQASTHLKRRVARTVLHVRNPDRAGETLHRPRTRTEDLTGYLLRRGIPWAGALVFWCVWLYLVRRQSWW